MYLIIKGRKNEELEAQCVFTKEDKTEIDIIRVNGVLCKKQTSSNEKYADATKGLHVFSHFDKLLDWCSYKQFKGPIYILMYKVSF